MTAASSSPSAKLCIPAEQQVALIFALSADKVLGMQGR